MVNSQLVTYIKQQIQLGEGEVPIKNSLKSVGWPEADIAEAFKSVSPAQVSASGGASSPTATQSPAAISVMRSPATETQKANYNPFTATATAVAERPAAGSPTSISFAAQKPVESSFQPKDAVAPARPMQSSYAVPSESKSKAGLITMILMGLIIAALSVFVWFLYKDNAALKASITDSTARLDALAGKVTNSDKSVADLNTSIKKMESDKKDLESQLALFLPLKMKETSLVATTTTGQTTTTILMVPEALTISGTLTSNPKGGYTLTTSKGIAVNIKNYKDVKVEAALKPLLLSQTELTGVPTVGAREISVTHVNGSLIQ